MEYIILIVFGVLFSGILLVMFQKNAELHDLIQKHEEKIQNMEKYINPIENDSLIRQRLSNTESRVTAVEKLLRSHTSDIDILAKRLKENNQASAVAGVVAGGATAEQIQALSNQIIFVNDRVSTVAAQVESVNAAQTYLATKSVMFENANICVLSGTENCPPNMRKMATFGIIGHSGDSPIPKGYFVSGPFNDNGWNWVHGGLCCVE